MTRLTEGNAMSRSTSSSSLWRPWTPVTQQADLQITEARGCRVRGADGTWYLDGISGVLNVSCGHGHPRLIEAAVDQMQRLVHYDPMAASHQPAETLARRIAEIMPGDLNESLLINSGSEGIEAALKICWQYWRHLGENRERIISLEAGYHGTTALGQELSRLPFTLNDWPNRFPVDHVALPMEPRALRTAEGAEALLGLFSQALKSGTPAAAVIVEPLLGLGGCTVFPEGFLAGLRRLCDEYGTLLILDEIFTGFGRTGRMFGFDHDGITPDIVVTSKGISSGLVPLAAVTATTAIKETFRNAPVVQGLRYGHTTGGHAVAAAVAKAVLDVMDEEKLVENAAAQGAGIRSGLDAFRAHPKITDIRGLGLVIAIEADSPESAEAIATGAMDNGLLVRAERGVVRIAPPLTITTDESIELVDKLSRAIATLG
ncbi:aspartate aminotransferase family protein [Nonomuraea sp. WAC 01424]|uniref:aminotransferase family protein n=1 Tax=Nonomuraea sp. WAC 01424 TaxID=2203200 RepID=UPI001C8C2DBF|nr:aspartate aminotransferase family protein [Nonomuraea sp. WAC 01424]